MQYMLIINAWKYQLHFVEMLAVKTLELNVKDVFWGWKKDFIHR